MPWKNSFDLKVYIVDAFIVTKIDLLFWYYGVEKKLHMRFWKRAMPKEKHYHNFPWKRKNEVLLGNCWPSRVVFHCKWLIIFAVEGFVSCPPSLHWSIVFKINTLFHLKHIWEAHKKLRVPRLWTNAIKFI